MNRTSRHNDGTLHHGLTAPSLCSSCEVKRAGSFGHHARLEDDNRRLSRTTRSVAVEVLVQFAPAPPQPLTLLAHCSPPEHLAPDPTGQLDHRLRMGLKI
jgi:hypothetical protein